MEGKVVFIGDVEMMDYPFIIGDDDWLIPKDWYLLNCELENRPIVIYKNETPVIIIEHVQILYNSENEEYRLSVIKTDKKLELDDVIIYE